MKVTVDVPQSGKLPQGKTEIPFSFPLEVKEGVKYFETYHGILVNVRYTLTCEIPRGVFSKTLKKSIEVLIVNYVCIINPIPLSLSIIFTDICSYSPVNSNQCHMILKLLAKN